MSKAQPHRLAPRLFCRCVSAGCVAMSVEQCIEIQKLVSIKIGGVKGRVVIPPSHNKHVGDKTFIHISTVPNFSTTLFTTGRCNVSVVGANERMLSRTDIVGQLTELRNQTIDETLNAVMDKDVPSNTLAMFTKSAKTSKRNRRVKVAHRLSIPTVMTIDVPSVDEIDGIQMDVLTTNKRAPSFVECIGPNIQYIRDACVSQLKSGSIKRCKTPMKDTTKQRKCSIAIDGDTTGGCEPIIEMGDVRVASVIDDAAPIAASPSPTTSDPIVTPAKHRPQRNGSIADFFKRL